MSLTGDLSEFGLAEVLQVLALSKKTGVLVLKGAAVRGRIVLEQGRPVDAEVEEGPVGEAAFFALLSGGNGRFTFRGSELEGKRRSIERPLETLLLEAGGRAGP